MATWKECEGRPPASGKKNFRPEAYGIERTCGNCKFGDGHLVAYECGRCDKPDLSNWKQK